jgi:hypothetical protein
VNVCSSDQSTKVNTYVSGKARYVKIAVVRMNSHASMRGDVLLSKVQAALPPVALANSSPAQYRQALDIFAHAYIVPYTYFTVFQTYTHLAAMSLKSIHRMDGQLFVSQFCHCYFDL